MFPVALDLTKQKIALIGGGKEAVKRLKLLIDANASNYTIFATEYEPELKILASDNLQEFIPSTAKDLEGFKVVMIVNIEDDTAFNIAKIAHAQNAQVNIEDKPEYCDFYFSSTVRSGDLVIGINTNGKSPTLSVRIRKFLSSIFNESWANYLDDIAQKRLAWKQGGLSYDEVIKASNDYIDQNKWFPELKKGSQE